MTLNGKLPDRYSDATIASDRINLRTFTDKFEPMPLAIWSTGCDVAWHERESSRDRFAGAKSHRTAFVGFATKDFRLDEGLRAYVSSSPCPVPGYGKEIIIREYDKTDDIWWRFPFFPHRCAGDEYRAGRAGVGVSVTDA